MKLSDRFMKLYHRLFGDEALQLARAGTIKTLETGRDLAELAPVPGLPAVLDVLIAILERVQVTKSNGDAVEGLREQIEGVYAALRVVAETVHREVNQIPAECPDPARAEKTLRDSLTEGFSTLFEELQTLFEQVRADAVALANKPWHTRFFRSKVNADAINSMKERVDRARQNFQLRGTVMIATSTETILKELMQEVDGRILKDLLPLDGASYLSHDNAPKGRFLQGTREEVFRNLDLWVEQTSKTGAENRVLVLIGAAGMGKSTIASEFCRRLSDQNSLGASFFFTRGTQLSSTRGFFNTIVYQLATLQPDRMHDAIVAAARKHLAKGGASQNMKDACENLVRTPLNRDVSVLPSNAPIFIVVDALDECTAEEVDTIPEFLALLFSCTQHAFSPLRIFLTSRPGSEHIRSTLDAHSFVSTQHFLDIGDREVVDCDIRAVITHRLSQHDTTRNWSDADPTIITRLVRQSAGIFVYASTAVEFLYQGHLSKQMLDERLALLLSPDRRIALPRLDNLYFTVLETAFPAEGMYEELRERLHLVLSAIAAHATLALGCMRLRLHYVEKYMPELLEKSPEMLELRKLREEYLRFRLWEKLRGKRVHEPVHSVYALDDYVGSYCAYHQELSTSVHWQSAEMGETARRFDRIPYEVFRAFTRAIWGLLF
ncbi:hypothetical protein C8Q76DRAFT_861684 [Earliella scabrosa]|nr:hypothetical protein C8Q76DRAFT_861684 [Earliella scabrosa]